MKNKGFTILELIVAIFVMTVGVLGAYSVVQQIIVYTLVSSSRLTAAYLAQEGIEIVRNIRDTNWFTNPADWNNGLTGCATGCEVDYNTSLSSYTGFFLKYSSTNGYNYSSGDPTKYKRKIIIDSSTNNILKVSVLVEWTEKGNPYTVTVEEHLYNWY